MIAPPGEPDLSAAADWLAARSPAERRSRGQWPTPWWLCHAVAARLAPELAGARVVDLAVGDGRWLLAVARAAPGARLTGFDTDPLALEAARITLDRAGVVAELICGDALAEGAVPACDWVVGNPPFVRPQHLDRAVASALWRRFAAATDKVDLAACFVERALERAPRLALVLPAALMSLTSWAAVRARLLRAGVDGVFELPADAFQATVGTVLVLAGPEDRRSAGRVDPDGFAVDGRLAVGAAAWSTDGPLPELVGAPLGDHLNLHMGIVCGDYPRWVHAGRLHPEDRPTCRGRDVQRFEVVRRDEFVRYLPREMLDHKPYVAPKHAGLFDVPRKLVVAGTTGRALRAAVDEQRLFPLDSCYVGHGRREGLDLYGAVGVLMSGLVGDWYGRRFRAARVKAVELSQIPVPDLPWDDIADAARARDAVGLEAAVGAAYARTEPRIG